MDSFGEILPFILAIFGLIYSALQKRKKEENKRAQAYSNTDEIMNDEPASNDIFKRDSLLLEELFGIPANEPAEVNDTSPSETVYETYEQPVENFVKDKEEPGKEIANNVPDNNTEKELSTQEKIINKPEVAEAFDLRKAVIYSEILNRKYF